MRPAAGGVFGAPASPILGNGATPMAPSDGSARVHFIAGRGTDIKYRRRGNGGMFAPMPGEADIGDGVLPAMGVNRAGNQVIAVWPPLATGGALTVKIGLPSSFTPFATDSLTGTPTAGNSLGAPLAGVAVDSDGSGVIVYTDAVSADGELSYIVRDPSTSTWSAPAALGDATGTTAMGFGANLSGDALVYWKDGASANHAVYREEDASAFGADDPLPAGTVTSLALQADGSALAVVVNAGDATLYRRPTTGGWTAISGPHAVNSLSGTDNAVVTTSRTGDKLAFAWTQKPADPGTQANRIFAQVGTAADLGPATALPSQPPTPDQANDNHNDLPVVTVDPSANALALWRGRRAAADPAGGHVFAAVFDPTVVPPVDPGGGGTPPPAGNPPPAENPPQPPPTVNAQVKRLLRVSLARRALLSDGVALTASCLRSYTAGCNGAITVIVAGSNQPGGRLRSAAKRPRIRFSHRLRTVSVSLRAGQRGTIKVRYSRAALAAVRRALRYRTGKVTAAVRVKLLSP